MNPIMMSLGNVAHTANGALSNASTGNACLDLFSKVGSARNMDETALKNLFYQAALEDVDVASRIMMWTRDCRGGAGERATFRKLLKEFESWCLGSPDGIKVMRRVADLTVELGRWDDLLAFDAFFTVAVEKIAAGIQANDQLLLKWLPREKSAKGAIAKRLMKALGLSPKQYRKMCSGVVTAETLMCAKKWEDINLSHVPSVASSRYQKAFAKNHPGYEIWKKALENGNAKVNASVSFPHDVWRTVKAGGDRAVIQAMWDALPNYIPEGVNILPIADTSSSMESFRAKLTDNLYCIDIAISLGAYLATKNTGPFKGALLTFNTNPMFHWMGNGNIADEMQAIKRMSWGGSTNFQATFELILAHAIKVGAKQEDMPQYVMCVSDMQFDDAGEGRYGGKQTNFEAIKAKFEAAGYKMPTLVFWTLNARADETPATAADKNVALVSGFSPAIMKSVLTGKEVSPVDIMMEAVGSDRYRVL